ncbi:MAG: radical SAM protein [Thermodesulfobacteriota bacterium]|nr:radical SAM protein [Thermodesulfobacteriota bacterium]
MFEGEPGRHLIVPLFIPNHGCPHRCIFCQQQTITAQSDQPIDKSAIRDVLDKSIKSKKYDMSQEREVAFYGGTFTRLPISKMTELLEAVTPYLDKGLFKSIRVSTRPDAMDKNRLDLMRKLGVSTVELGAQSMDDRVLELSERGHTARDTIEAVYRLRRHGFTVGIQLMPGLPGDSEEKFMKTVEEVIKIHPDMVRIYPALVINGTVLARMYYEKRYEPLQFEEAVNICKKSCIRLESKGIPVIRIGLMSSPTLRKKGQIVAGPWHEAFGFLVRSAIHWEKIKIYLPVPGKASKIRIRAPLREIPLIRGYKNLGLHLIKEKTGSRIMGVISDESVPLGQISVDKI